MADRGLTGGERRAAGRRFVALHLLWSDRLLPLAVSRMRASDHPEAVGRMEAARLEFAWVEGFDGNAFLVHEGRLPAAVARLAVGPAAVPQSPFSCWQLLCAADTAGTRVTLSAGWEEADARFSEFYF